MNNQKIFILIVCIIVFAFTVSCKDEGMEPDFQILPAKTIVGKLIQVPFSDVVPGSSGIVLAIETDTINYHITTGIYHSEMREDNLYFQYCWHWDGNDVVVVSTTLVKSNGDLIEILNYGDTLYFNESIEICGQMYKRNINTSYPYYAIAKINNYNKVE